MHKFRVKILYSTKDLTQVSDFMRVLDSGFERCLLEQIWEFNSKTDDVELLKYHIRRSFDNTEAQVYDIEVWRKE